MWDSKRKFLTFIEEIALLVNSGEIRREVAMYMFGYYACCARSGSNFSVGIALDHKYWRLFFSFSDEAKIYLSSGVGSKGVSDLKL